MRRHLIPIEAVADPVALRQAFLRASRGKRHRSDQQHCELHLDHELDRLRTGILDGTVEVGRCRTFVVHDPKRRNIHAPIFLERVLHHALMAPIEPVLERTAIAHSYACRRGKGQFAALRHAGRQARRWPWYLQLDVRAYFDRIPHDQVLATLARRISGDQVLALCERIIRSHAASPGRGLPIGALTSQHLANAYLGPLDRLVVGTLKLPYVRYMDDLVCWGSDRSILLAAADRLEAMAGSLGLSFKPAIIQRSRGGLRFLGWKQFPGCLRLDRRGTIRLWRRWRWYERCWREGSWSAQVFQQRTTALLAWVRQGDTSPLRRRIMTRLASEGGLVEA